MRGALGAHSEKRDKRNAHKALRQAERLAIARDEPGPRPRDVSDPWDFAKDGKIRIGVSQCLSTADVRRILKK